MGIEASDMKADTLNTGYSYDAAGNLIAGDYTTNSDIRLAYDALKRLTNKLDAVGTTVYRRNSPGLL